MPSPKFQRFGEVVATRYRNGACEAVCNRNGCRAYASPDGWRRTVRLAREHAAAHAATAARDVSTPWGRPAHELPHTRRRPHRRLAAAVVVVLALAVLAFGLTLANVAGHAAPAAPASSIAVVPTTTLPVGPGEYVPTPAGPPATDTSGQWISQPDPSTSTSRDAGGGR